MPPVIEDDGERARRLQARLGPMPSGLALIVRQYTSPRLGTRVIVTGIVSQIAIAQDVGVLHHLTGDHVLDGRLQVGGPAALVAALMSAPAREALKALLAVRAIEPGSLTVRAGELSVEVPRFFDLAGPDPVDQAAEAALEVAKRLRPPRQLQAALAANARRDPHPAVRLRNVKVLLRESPPYAGTLDVLRAAAADADGEVRLAAAQALGAEGVPVLRGLARDPAVADDCSARAVEALERLDLDDARAILAGPRPLTARACVSALARIGGPDEAAVLAGALAAEVTVAVAAAAALGRIGTAEALLALREAARVRRGKARRAALAAAAEIQSRTGAAPGRLTLSAGDAGQVALAPDADGRLSIDEARPSREDDPPGG